MFGELLEAAVEVADVRRGTGDALAVGVGFPSEEDTGEVWGIVDQYVNAAITKEMTPEEAIEAMTEEVNTLRKEGGYIS